MKVLINIIVLPGQTRKDWQEIRNAIFTYFELLPFGITINFQVLQVEDQMNHGSKRDEMVEVQVIHNVVGLNKSSFKKYMKRFPCKIVWCRCGEKQI